MTEFQVLRAEKWFDRVVFMLDLSNWRFSEYAAIGVFMDAGVNSAKKIAVLLHNNTAILALKY